ncbi:hypothetical protein SATMO3_02900 [Sporomusa aerivorans]
MAILLICGLQLSTGCGLNSPAPKPQQVRQVAEDVTIEGLPVGNLTAEEAGRVLNNLAEVKDVPAVNAGYDPVGGQVVPERPGQRINVPDTLSALLAAPAGSSIKPVYQPFRPEITRDILLKSHRLGSFTTPILDRSPGRTVNIRLTAKLTNNSLIAPGQEFSFNNATGEPTSARGFQKAAVFGDNGEKEEGLGGGMCQVSSTLYNAVLAAGLNVTERHPHSQPVNYVAPGKDATTYTDKDFRFVNNTRRRIITRIFTDGADTELTAELWALPDE